MVFLLKLSEFQCRVQMDNLERAFYAQQTQPPVLGEDGEIEEEILSFETGLATNAIL